jgi:hypothetical protein
MKFHMVPTEPKPLLPELVNICRIKMPLSGFIDPNSKEAKAKEIKISSTNGNGENVAIVLDDDNSKQDRPNYDKQYYALHKKLILEKKKNTISNRMLNNIMPNTIRHTMKPIRKN